MGQRNEYGKRASSRSDYNDDRRSKRQNNGDDRDKIIISSDDTVYRYLCPSKKIGSIMGKGGDIVKRMRSETNSKIRIGETVSGCDERVITIYSASNETNDFDDVDRVCPAQDALFKVHDRVADELALDEMREEEAQVTARLLVPSDQIGCIIGKGGHVVQSIRTDTGAQIRILKDRNLPSCAVTGDELVQISGEASNVRKALFKIASRIHDNPSRSQHTLGSSTTNMYPSGGAVMGMTTGPPIMGLGPMVGAYGEYKGEAEEWARRIYPAPRREVSSKEFSLRMICPIANVGSVIGKGGVTINQIRQESRAVINVNSSTADDEDCIISISSKEIFDDTISPTIEAAIRLQPRCSERVERDSGHVSFTTRLLVPTSQVGCLIGKGGAKISEMRRITKASIRVLTKEDLPKVAEKGDEMVQITAELDVAKDALLQVALRLRGDLFEKEGVVSTFFPVLPYLPVAPEVTEIPKHERRDYKGYERGNLYSSSYEYDAANDLPPNDGYGSYGSTQGRIRSDAYGAYDRHASGRSGNSSRSRYNYSPRRRDRGY
ncbi:KH domain-containing protein At4g18375-like [Rutidosis leptorrhynchoides]|uniref:KH domain-containing protein At4g18375-like n=1 Tax=Rutidosis leptorrhynchoides TaxID=125765 RepID=UPI003A9987B7